MDVVDAASTFAATSGSRDERRLQEWALSRRSPVEQAVATDLVLIHDFDEPVIAPQPGADAEQAEAVRERYLVALTGIGTGRPVPAQNAAHDAGAQRLTPRSRGAAPERRLARARAGASSR